jgi:flagellar biosynthesis protein FliR
MLRELLALNVFSFFLVFSRIGTALLLLPAFSAGWVNSRTRLLMALTISFAMFPVLADRLPGLPVTVSALALLIGGEIAVGAFLGTLGRIIMGALQTAGTLIAYFSSMANAMIQDPIAEQQSSLISNFLSVSATVLIVITGLHHLILRALSDSYSLFVPGEMISLGDFTEAVTVGFVESFSLGVQLASPFIVTAITYYLGLGLLGRLMPQLPVFFVGLPLQISMQIITMILVISTMMMVFLSRLENVFFPYLAP